jgi:hypothetical protein
MQILKKNLNGRKEMKGRAQNRLSVLGMIIRVVLKGRGISDGALAIGTDGKGL